MFRFGGASAGRSDIDEVLPEGPIAAQIDNYCRAPAGGISQVSDAAESLHARNVAGAFGVCLTLGVLLRTRQRKCGPGA